MVQRREQELVKPREGELGFRERARRGHDRNSSLQRPLLCCGEQGGLADACLAANDEGPAALLDPVDQCEELGQVSIAPEKLAWRGGNSLGAGLDCHP